jgi:Zn-dependent protease with chaperone function
MIGFVALPLVIAIAAALLSGRALDRLAPAPAARWNTVLLVAVVVAAVPTFWILALSGLTHFGVRNSLCDWSAHLLPAHPVAGAAIGGTALLVSVVGAIRVVRVLITHFRIRCTERRRFELIETAEVFAYTLPGPARTIAISRGLRQTLDDCEFDFVLAHEQAHARHRHDRYLLLGLLVSAAVPFMKRADVQLRYHLERWADEDAVLATGTNRKVAARTIAKVALSRPASPALLAIASHGIAARAGALMDPPPIASRSHRLQIVGAVIVTVALSLSQVHHTVDFAFRTMA